MEPRGRIGVLGTGTMGAGIVQLAAQSGYAVVACDAAVESLERAENSVREGLARLVGKGAISEDEAAAHYDRIHWTTSRDDLRGADAAVEAIVEKVEPKKEALAALDAVLPADALLLTNTSSISITNLADAADHPGRVCGMHFFTPPPVREAVEIPRGQKTTDETVERTRDLVRSFGKTPVVVDGDVPGFVANRFLAPMLLEACRLLEQGAAPQEDIDKLVTKGLGFPIGPFELGDLIGLDVALDVTAHIHKATGDAYYKPPQTLQNLVRSGHLGRKTGKGFYEY